MKKRKRVTIVVLAVCLLCVNIWGTIAKAEDAQPTVFYVLNPQDFMSSVNNAKNGDIITVAAEITLTDNVQMGGESKCLTIKRNDSDSRIILGYGITVNAANITFDGGGYNAAQPFLTSNADAIFTECTFQNCGSIESLSSNGSIGGAVRVQSCSAVFNDCSFNNNYAVIGGHIAVDGYTEVTMNHCIMKNGGAVNNGGGIAIVHSEATCEINGGEITDNRASDFGGGVSNWGKVTITGAKIYANSAVNGGADIATKISGNTILSDTVEQMNELFAPDGLQVTGWVCDYDFENGIYIPNVEPTQENALLKLDYSVILPTESETTTDPTEESGEDVGGQEEESGTDGSDNSGSSGSGTSTDNSNHVTNSNTDTDNSNQVTNTDNSTRTDSTSIVNTGDTTNSSTSNSTADNSVNDSSSWVDNSKVDNRSGSNTTNTTSTTSTTTTNNYYHTAEGSGSGNQPGENSSTYISLGNTTGQAETVDNSAAGQNNSLEAASPQSNISIDAKGVDCSFEIVDGAYHISINSSQATDTGSERTSNLDPFQIVQLMLLAAILICMIWKPKEKKA